MTACSYNDYEEIALLLRDFALEYSWLFNFSNVNIIVDDFIKQVDIIF